MFVAQVSRTMRNKSHVHPKRKGVSYNKQEAALPKPCRNFLYKIKNWASWVVHHGMQGLEDRPGIAECCGGNTQGSGASGSDNEPLNNFIDRFCSLQLTGHTTPVYFSLQQPWKASRV